MAETELTEEERDEEQRIAAATRQEGIRALTFARNALTWMSPRNIPPTPDNFELAYAYVSGEHAAFKAAIDALTASGCRFDASILSMLHQRHFRAWRNDEAIAETGGRIAAKLGPLLHLLESAGRDQSAYRSTLSEVSGELGDVKMPGSEIKQLIERLLQATFAMEKRSRTLEQELQSSSREVGDLRERLVAVQRESQTDQLTNLLNRRAFDMELDSRTEEAVESGEPLSLIMCDIDHFKSINDNFGHQTGDQVLRLVANCISENVKGRDSAARYGGEEFVVILPQTTLADAVILADQIRVKVEAMRLVKKNSGQLVGPITISMGAAIYDANDSPVEFLRRADCLLYAAKRGGRNRVVSAADAGSAAMPAHKAA